MNQSEMKPGLLLIVLLGFALRLFRLGEPGLWYDETVSVFLAAQPIPELIGRTARDIHPPGYYLLLHFWSRLAGETEFALAFFSLIFGLLLIPLTYRLARRLVDQPAARWAALLAACSPYQIWYSQEVRMYTLGAAAGLAALFCLDRALADPERPGLGWIGYLGWAMVGLYSLYYFAFLLIVVNLYFLVVHRAARRLLLAVNGLAVILYLPWLPVFWRQATNPPVPPWRSAVGFGPMLLESWTALSFGQSVDPATIWPLLLLTLGLYLLGLHYAAKHPSTPLLLSFYTFGPLLLLYLFSFITPLYHARYLFTYAAPFYILLGAGLARLQRYRLAWLAAGLIVAGSAFSLGRYHFAPQYRSDDYRAAVAFIEERWQPGDAILINAGYVYPAFLYYADLPGLQRQRLVPYRPPEDPTRPVLLLTGSVGGGPQLGWGDPRADFYPMTAAETIAALEAVRRDFGRLWLLRVYDTVTDPAGLIRAWLSAEAVLIEDQGFAGSSYLRAQGYLFDPPPPAGAIPRHFEAGLALAGWQYPDRSWPPGGSIPVRLWWMATEPPPVDYKMSLKLWSGAGELAAAGRDQWPVGSLHRPTDWPLNRMVYQAVALPLPPDIPPGQYWLNVELYHPETIQPLPLLDGSTAVSLGPVTIY